MIQLTSMPSAATPPVATALRYRAAMLALARGATVATAAVLPFSTAATSVFMLLALLGWLLAGEWRTTLRAIAAQPAAWMGCALCAALLLGVLWSLAPSATALAALGKYRELLLFGVVMHLCGDARWRWRVLWAFLGSAMALLVVSYLISFGLISPRGNPSMARDNAVFLKSHITHGFIMSLLAYAACLWGLRQQGWRRTLGWSIALLAAANVWLAVQGRTGYVVLAALLLWFAASQWSRRGLVVGLLALAALLAASYQWAPNFQMRAGKALEEAADYLRAPPSRPEVSETPTGLRLHFWRRSLDALARRPLLGAGTGGWSEAFYQATAGDPPALHDRAHMHPHNEYLNLAVQLGPAGLVLLLALFAAAFRAAGRLPANEARLAEGVVLAFAVGCLFNDLIWDMTEGHIWAVVGGALFGASRMDGKLATGAAG
jgi:O-antigen ligase